MPITTKDTDPEAAKPVEPDAKYAKAGPPSPEELQKIIDNVPDGGVPGRIDEGEYVPDEPGEPGWPAAPVKAEK